MTNRDAIDILRRLAPPRTSKKHFDDFMQAREMAINSLSQPERIKGHWIEGESQCGIKCSKCGCPVDDFCYSIDYIDLDYAPNYCPNCGSDNREVTECLD